MNNRHKVFRDKSLKKLYAKFKSAHPFDDGKSSCIFCNVEQLPNEILESSANFWLIKNHFPYKMWDNREVKDHLLIVPKIHVDSIAHLSKSARRELIEALTFYEGNGYSIYARAPASNAKSVWHQHTHLIKV